MNSKRQWVLGLVLWVLGVLVWGGACGKNFSQILFHETVEVRSRDSLLGGLTVPTAMTPVDPLHFTFAVMADVQVRAENRHLLTRFKSDVAGNGIEFFVVLGDLTEDGTSAEYTAVKADLASVGIPYYATVGNHDLFQAPADGGWNGWKSNFGAATYAVTIANAVRFLFLDSASGEIGSRQFEWLESQLKTPTAAPITIVGTHFPIYDSITPIMWRLSSVAERYKLVSMLDSYGVYAFISGHIHGARWASAGRTLHFITGSMYPYDLDYGNHGYLLMTYDHGAITYRQVYWPDTP